MTSTEEDLEVEECHPEDTFNNREVFITDLRMETLATITIVDEEEDLASSGWRLVLVVMKISVASFTHLLIIGDLKMMRVVLDL